MTDVEYVTAAELTNYPGVSAPTATLEVILGILNGLANELIGQLDQPYPVRVKAIIMGAAAAYAGNPEGLAQYTVQIDDFKATRIYPDGSVRDSGSEVGFTADQVSRLLRAAGLRGPRRSIQSIRVQVPGYMAPTAGMTW